MSFSLCCSSSLEPLNPNPIPQGFPPSKTKSPSSQRLFQTTIKRDQLHQNYTSNNLHKAVLVQPPDGLHHPYKAKSTRDDQLKYVRTLLVDNYDSYTFNIYQYLSLINNVPPVVVRNDEWTWKEAYYYLYEERAFDNIVISPGPGSPECPDDIGLCLQLLLECRDIPILGVCLGHQALGYVHGARIVHAPQPIHGRLSEIEHNDSELFHNIPSGRNSGFKVVRYHSLVIDAATLPKDLVPIAWTSSSNTLSFLETSSLILDPFKKECIRSVSIKSPLPHLQDGSSLFSLSADNFHSDKVLMGIRHIDRPHYGLQFHPESVATSYGSQMFKNFRDITVAYWEGLPSSFNRNFNACSQVGQTVEPQKTLRSSRLYPSDFTNRYFSNLFNTSQKKIREVKLRWKKIDFLANEVGGASNIFCRLFGDCKAEETFWLDSSSIEKRRARFSLMGKKGGSLWKQLTFKLSAESCGGHLSIEDAQGNTTSMYLENGFLDFLNKELQLIHCDEEDYHGLPFDFCGGYIGYIGYNLKVECGAASNRHNSCAPDACFFFADNFIVIDHDNGDVYVMSIHEKSTDPTQWLDDMHQSLLSLNNNSTSEVSREHYPAPPPVISPFEAGFISEKTRDEYIGDVDKCLGYIRDGESYELCFTTQMRKNIRDMDPLDLYLKLREQNPAPYAAWLNFPSVDLCICSSSPERFLRLDRDGVLEAKPIKGTIARGSTLVEDEHLKSLLQYSEKDQAENLMIVDLLRNDLGQVCEPGSVHVPHLMEVETYATVHTMVSTIRGKKRENVSPVDCVRAAFPGGSMTGAPKLRSMEILDSLESCSRGVYSGSIGYFSINATFDLNIVIRSVVIHKGEASIGAGGAIVALSKPEDEYEEMVLKTRAPTRAIVACQS